MDENDYMYRVFYSEEDGEYVAKCTEFPSMSSLHENAPDALRDMMDLIADTLEDMRESGEEPPEPLNSVEYSGKVTLRMTPEMHRKVAIKAKEDGTSLNRLLIEKIGA